MPTLPNYDSQQNIRPMTPGPLRDEASKEFEDQQQVLGVMQEITQKWSDANDVMEYTEAKAKHALALTQLESEASADPDFKNSDKYQKRLSDLRSSASQGIKNQQLASKAAIEFNHAAEVSGIKIKGSFAQKQIVHNKAMLKTNLDALVRNKLSAVTEAQALKYQADIEELLSVNLNAGVIDLAEANEIALNAEETAVKYEIYADQSIREEDSTLLKQLQDPEGKYSFLPPDTRLQMIEESQRRIFQNNQTYKRETENSRNQRFDSVFDKANRGELTLTDLDQEMAIPEEAGGIPKKQLLSIREGIQQRIDNDLTAMKNNKQAKAYLKLVNNFISDETDRQKGREMIVNYFKDGILSTQEVLLLNSLKRETEDIQWARQKEGMSANNLIPFKNAYNAVIGWFRGSGRHDEPEAAMAIKKLLNGAANGANLDDVTQEIFKEDRVTTTPDIKSFPTTGQRMVDPVTGVEAIVYPDGTIEVQNGGIRRKPSNSGK